MQFGQGRNIVFETIYPPLDHVINPSLFNLSANSIWQITDWSVFHCGIPDEGFKEDIEEEADMEPDDKYSTILKEHLDADSFDENNDEHLDLARYFLEGQFYC